MLRALAVLGLLAAGQAWITKQTRARRQFLASSVDARSMQNWEDEGGASPAVTSAPQRVSQLNKMGPGDEATGTMGDYPSAAQAG